MDSRTIGPALHAFTIIMSVHVYINTAHVVASRRCLVYEYCSVLSGVIVIVLVLIVAC